jgi:hypothetical protein
LQLAERLEACCRKHRCLSGACPGCGVCCNEPGFVKVAS